ncbi:MAG: GMC family oxidoreductase, partial [Sphaerobacteraceae bacterium]
ANSIDVVIAGGGTSGAALAGLLVEEHGLNVCLIEAGPDYGLYDPDTWPPELLNASTLPGDSHSWGYIGMAHPTHTKQTGYDRARVIGGCSSHNGCIALLGHARDYDAWSESGIPGWSFGSVWPSFQRAMKRLRIRQPGDEEITPYQRLFLEGAQQAGIPQVADLNQPDDVSGVAAAPVNIAEGTRWNTALAYLTAEVRESGSLTILDNAVVDRVTLDGERATGVVIRRNGAEEIITGDRIVLSAGAYGSPGILERSGIGDPKTLEAVGVDVAHALPGVGASLTDHPAVCLTFRGGDEINAAMSQQRASGWCPDEQVLAKTRSSRCKDAFDLHIYSVSGFNEESGDWEYEVYVSSVFPRSRGAVHVRSADPEEAPDIDHGFLSEPDGEDIAVLLEGVKLARSIMQPALDSGALSEETLPGVEVQSDDDLRQFIIGDVGIYYHPSSTCRMGPPTSSSSVVDSLGRVFGVSGLHVCDASIFPVLMRANTNLPAVMVAEHLAPSIAAGR